MKKNARAEELKRQAKDLEEILLGIDSDGIDAIQGEEILPKLKAIAPLDYDAVKSIADERASNIVESVILMYLPQELVSSEDYVYQKMEVDKMTVSNLLFQMRTAEHAIKKLLQEIDGGDTQPRFFEVLASLQKSKMEIVKHLAAFMVTMESNYKNLKYDWQNLVDKKEEGDTPALPEHDESTDLSTSTAKFRGTKSLMTMLQNSVEEAKKKMATDDFKDVTGGETPDPAGE